MGMGVLLAISLQSTEMGKPLTCVCLPALAQEHGIRDLIAYGLTWKKVTILPTAAVPYGDTSHPSEWTV